MLSLLSPLGATDQEGYGAASIRILEGFERYCPRLGMLRDLWQESYIEDFTPAPPAWISVKELFDETMQSRPAAPCLQPTWYCRNQLLVLTLCQNARAPPFPPKEPSQPRPHWPVEWIARQVRDLPDGAKVLLKITGLGIANRFSNFSPS